MIISEATKMVIALTSARLKFNFQCLRQRGHTEPPIDEAHVDVMIHILGSQLGGNLVGAHLPRPGNQMVMPFDDAIRARLISLALAGPISYHSVLGAPRVDFLILIMYCFRSKDFNTRNTWR